MHIEILPFSQVPFDRFAVLARAIYPVEHFSCQESYQKWLHQENPVAEGSLVVAQDESGKWAGLMGLVPRRIAHGDQTWIGRTVVDVMVHPEFRRQNLFVKMIEALKVQSAKSGEWILGYPNAQATPGWKRTAMAFMPGYEVMVQRLHMMPDAKGWQKISYEEDLKQIDFSQLMKWRRRLGSPVLDMDADILAWRYLKHPMQRYNVYIKKEGKILTDYVVSRSFRFPLTDLIVDFQGKDVWHEGPPALSRRFHLVAWPRNDTGQLVSPAKSMIRSPVKRKIMLFFATPPSACFATEPVSWPYFTLSAADF